MVFREVGVCSHFMTGASLSLGVDWVSMSCSSR
jgi:hypothetical protein